MSRVRIGVIGVGHMGQFHANILAGLDGVDFVGIHDAQQERAERLATKFGVKIFESVDRLLSKVDAVCVAVPTNYHYKVASLALKAGVHVLVEKPMTRTVRYAERLVALANERGLILQTGHVERFNGAIRQIGNIINQPKLVEARRLSPWMPRIKDVGVVLDLMVHDVDIVLGLINSPVTAVDAVGTSVYSPYEDAATAILQFENGCVANLTASRITNEKIRTLSISQKDAYICLDYNRQGIDIYRRLSQDYSLKHEEIRYTIETTVERVFVHSVNPLQQELMHFCDCVRGVATPLVTGESDINTLRLTRTILERINAHHLRDEE
jgi:predicted dehydrogenase